MRLSLVLALSTVLAASAASAGELRYTPVNPNFGGSPFNGSTLLSQASAQNHFKAPTPETDPIQEALKNRTSSLLYGAVTQGETYLYSKILPGNLQPRVVPLERGYSLIAYPDIDTQTLKIYIRDPQGGETYYTQAAARNS